MDHRRDFGRRAYGSLSELLRDQARLLSYLRRMRRDRGRGPMTPEFRQRLMLAHTHASECRHCSWYHARVALRSGVPEEQVGALLCGAVGECPQEEGVALLYAVQFAETDGRPDAEARQELARACGVEGAGAVERVLRAIRSGNLIGNSFDYPLWRVSGGRLGTKEHLPLERHGEVYRPSLDK